MLTGVRTNGSTNTVIGLSLRSRRIASPNLPVLLVKVAMAAKSAACNRIDSVGLATRAAAASARAAPR